MGWGWWYPLRELFEELVQITQVRCLACQAHLSISTQSQLLITSFFNWPRQLQHGWRHMGSGTCWSFRRPTNRRACPLSEPPFSWCVKWAESRHFSRFPHKHLAPAGMPYYYYFVAEGWQAQSQAGRTGAEVRTGGGTLSLNLFLILLQERPPQPQH